VVATLRALSVSFDDAVSGVCGPAAGAGADDGSGSVRGKTSSRRGLCPTDALAKVLSTQAHGAEPRDQLYCVFGCGGDRDASKRPLMAAAAGCLDESW
jgi:UDP-N-acetylmuramoyl-L-alanyl-D-glutamate--2,6-diaminopimelate ligase